MPNEKLKDQITSHRVLNYLNASYQGLFASINILSQVKHPGFEAKRLQNTKDTLQTINAWLDGLWNGETLFEESRGTKQREPAQKALALLQILQPELASLAVEIKNIMQAEQLGAQLHDVGFLIAALGRGAYARENYIKGFVDFGTTFNDSNLVSVWKPRLTDAAERITLSNEFVLAFKKQENIDPPFFRHLAFFCRTLPGVFKSHIHDIHQLLWTFKGKLSYERTGFLKPEASVWDRAEINPVEAGYWRAHEFSSDEALIWRKDGFVDAEMAAEWRAAGFSSDQALPWMRLLFSPLLAIQWFVAKYTAEESAMLVSKGYYDPSVLTSTQAEQLLLGEAPEKVMEQGKKAKPKQV